MIANDMRCLSKPSLPIITTLAFVILQISHTLKIHSLLTNDQYGQVDFTYHRFDNRSNTHGMRISLRHDPLAAWELPYADPVPTDTEIQSKLTNINLQISAINNTILNNIKQPTLVNDKLLLLPTSIYYWSASPQTSYLCVVLNNTQAKDVQQYLATIQNSIQALSHLIRLYSTQVMSTDLRMSKMQQNT